MRFRKLKGVWFLWPVVIVMPRWVVEIRFLQWMVTFGRFKYEDMEIKPLNEWPAGEKLISGPTEIGCTTTEALEGVWAGIRVNKPKDD